MNSNNSFQIVQGLRLVIVVHRNNLTREGISEMLNDVLQNPFFQSDFSVVIDIRNAEISMETDEIEGISKLAYGQLSKTGLKKLAILTKTLSQTNKAVEFVRFYKESTKYQVFTTLEAALHWLHIPMERKTQIEVRLGWMNSRKPKHLPPSPLAGPGPHRDTSHPNLLWH